MNEIEQRLAAKFLTLADDELILAHRNSEWTGHAPILEEDIAFANIAQDELGHATLWYNLRAALTGEEPDELVFFRDGADFVNAQMMELPKGDWAFTAMRQYLFDALEMIRLPFLMESHYQPLAETAAKIRPEEIYHYRHSAAWVKRLGLGTAESARRMQAALDELWPYTRQLFAPPPGGALPGEETLVEAGYWPDPAQLEAGWLAEVRPFLTAANLTIPTLDPSPTPARAEHTPHLADLLADLQAVARLDRAARW
jgi:ring-1,2-phenylacetyl-CoA epoxidase subunit PaaC